MKYHTQSPDQPSGIAPEIVANFSRLIDAASKEGTIPKSINGGALLTSKHLTPEEKAFLETLARSAGRIATETCEHNDGTWTRTARVIRRFATGAIRGEK